MERRRINNDRGSLKTLFLLMIGIPGLLLYGCRQEVHRQTAHEYYTRLPNLSKTESGKLIKLARPVPDSIRVDSAKIDSVNKIHYKNGLALLVYGELPNSCSHLYNARTRIEDDTLFIGISTWQRIGLACKSKPVSFLYANRDLPPAEFESVKIYISGNAVRRFHY